MNQAICLPTLKRLNISNALVMKYVNINELLEKFMSLSDDPFSLQNSRKVNIISRCSFCQQIFQNKLLKINASLK